MDNDPILKDKSVGLNEDKGISSPYTQGLYILNLSNNDVEKIGTFINEFYEKLNKGITRNALTMFKGAVFAVGTKELNNPEWKEHCASSLREIFHAWDALSGFNSDFCQKYKTKNSQLTQYESDTLRDFWDRYEYFSGIDHHEAAKIMGALKKIKNDQRLKLEDCFEDSIFIEEVKRYFSLLSIIISFQDKNL